LLSIKSTRFDFVIVLLSSNVPYHLYFSFLEICRTNPHPLEITPSSKFERNNDLVVIKSPVTADARPGRRQSLTNVSIPRRSSLGGQSTDAGKISCAD